MREQRAGGLGLFADNNGGPGPEQTGGRRLESTSYDHRDSGISRMDRADDLQGRLVFRNANHNEVGRADSCLRESFRNPGVSGDG